MVILLPACAVRVPCRPLLCWLTLELAGSRLSSTSAHSCARSSIISSMSTVVSIGLYQMQAGPCRISRLLQFVTSAL